jgi:hypothetical protein
MMTSGTLESPLGVLNSTDELQGSKAASVPATVCMRARTSTSLASGDGPRWHADAAKPNEQANAITPAKKVTVLMSADRHS